MRNKKPMYAMVSKKRYKNLLTYFPVVTVDVLFFDPKMKKTLLFKRKNPPLKNKYFSMGGRVARNELLIDTAVRKTREELGISINKKKLSMGGVQDEMHEKSIFPGTGYHAVDVFYAYVLRNEKITLDPQHSGYKWFSVTDRSLHPFIKSKIKSILKSYDKTH